MDRLLSLLRANPGLLVMVAIVVIATAVLGIIAVTMSRGGQSLRPIAFIAVFMAIIVGPQAVWHTLVALGKVEQAPTYTWGSSRDASSPTTVPGDAELTARATGLVARKGSARLALDFGRFRDPARIFVPDVDTSLVRRDAKGIFGTALANARHSEMAFLATGETILAATFPSTDAARIARDAYLRFFGGNAPAPDVSFSLLRRPSGDVAAIAIADDALFAWTAASAERALEVAAKSEAIRLEPRTASPSPVAASADSSGSSRPYRVPTWAFVAFALLNLGVAVAWFFKGVAWAGSIGVQGSVAATSADTLRARLLAVASDDVPYDVRPGASPEEIEVTWKWADARWIDLARARRVVRTHRLVLRLDEAAHVVHVLEFSTDFDASAGRGGASIAWKASRGVTFFQKEYEKGLGLALDERGRPTGALTYSWRFDVGELKAPFIRTVTTSGWEWRPALF